MSVSKEKLLHIAKLADLKIDEKEIEKYIKNLDDILDYVRILEKAPIGDLNETIGANDNFNVFRKDEVKEFGNRELLLQNAPSSDNGMFHLPKVIN